jgi:hypothetical protein
MPVILSTWEAKIWRIVVQGQLGQKSKTAKWTGRVAQVVDHLLCKCKAPSSNPSPTKKKRLYLFLMTVAYILLLWIQTMALIEQNKKGFL